MTKYRKQPVVIEAITFAELVQHGIKACIDEGRESSIVNGMPWSFTYKGQAVSHENDECYLIPTLEGTMLFTPDDMLITGVKGEIYPCKKDIFAATYDVVLSTTDQVTEQKIQDKGPVAPRVTLADFEANIEDVEIVKHISRSGQVLRWAVLTTKNGFAVTGRPSVSVSPENDNEEIGTEVATDNARNELWPLMGYALREKLA